MAEIRFPLNARHRLKTRKLLEKVVTGRKVYTSHIKCFYFLNPDPPLDVDSVAAFTVPKRQFRKAVHRNLLRRRMKEAFRLQKPEFDEKLRENGIQCAILFVFTGKEQIPFSTFQEVINQIISRILKDGSKPG